MFSIAFSNFSFGNKNVIKDYISNDCYSFEKIGVLMINYGEPEVFEEDTYGDFKAYMNFMMNIGMIPSFLKYIDKGTIYNDINNEK
ncbi:MAG: hypothetical protein V5A68_02825 [Candidatus Thermoplasmatota archaeon]